MSYIYAKFQFQFGCICKIQKGKKEKFLLKQWNTISTRICLFYLANAIKFNLEKIHRYIT